MPLRLLLVALLGLALGHAGEAPAKPLLATLFGDHAVLQRDRPVALWGWAEAGSVVTAKLGEATAIATCGADGRWLARLPAQPAGGPHVLEVVAGTKRVQSQDVLVGDVWLCTGQSNMEYPVSGAKDAAAEKAAADWPQLRHFAAGRLIAGEPQAQTSGKWLVCTPANVGIFTAVGYFFGRKLHQDLKIPIGLVNSSYGGTRVEAWTSAEVLSTIPASAAAVTAFQDLVARSNEQRARTGKDYDTLIRAWYREHDPGSAGEPAPWADPATATADGWSEVTLPARLKQAKAVPAGFTGTVWLRRDFELSAAAAAAKGGMLNLIRVKDTNAAWINGTSIGDSEQVNWFRKQRVPAGLLRPGRNTVAVRLVCLEGECGLTGKAEELALTPEGQPPVALAGVWKLRLGTAFADAPPVPVRYDRVPGPTSLYNGMIAPLLPLTVAGAIWYQGEGNTDAAYLYRSQLPAMIRDWRARFGQELPFLIVQLANHMGRGTRPETSAWAELREAQALTAREVPGCGLAVAIDIGEELNIHPLNKQEVGRRLALLAVAQVHHLPVAASGPRFRAATAEGATLRLAFDETAGLATSDGAAPIGFAVAGKERKFVWATARIDGATVVVSAPEVAEPVAVRYAWGNNPACNLTNASGLPASPFRSDDWPGVTWPKP